jgi:NTP pyrophosphatase (non-canonical NTP hydrolase)
VKFSYLNFMRYFRSSIAESSHTQPESREYTNSYTCSGLATICDEVVSEVNQRDESILLSQKVSSLVSTFCDNIWFVAIAAFSC